MGGAPSSPELNAAPVVRWRTSSTSSLRPFYARSDPDLRKAQIRAERRVGRISAEGRYHRLPRRITDDYVIEGKPLGSGYNGTVYAGRCRTSGTPVAVKSFRLKGVQKTHKQDLIGEVETFLTMDHPHVARLSEVYESDTQVHIVMERMTGGELFKRIRERKVFGEGEAAEAAYQMLLAISYIHNEGVVHRDLKLENFLYDKEGSNFLKLIDFGFSKFFEKNKRQRMVESLGTITYVAPEVLAKSYTCGSCDMWSFGVIVFILLSGYMPFSGSADSEIAKKIRMGRYVMRPSSWDRVSDESADFVKRLLVVKPEQRLTAEQALAHPWIARRPAPTDAVVAETHVARSFLQFARSSPLQQACLQMMAWSLSLEDRRRLRDLFLDLDHSGTGVLYIADVREMLKNRLSSEADSEQVASTLAEMDTDGDGEIHYSDCLAAILATEVDMHSQALELAFRRFDAENVGFVTCDGLAQVLRPRMSRREVEVVFREVDSDQDGKITVDEFVRYMKGEKDVSRNLRQPETVRCASGCGWRRSLLRRAY